MLSHKRNWFNNYIHICRHWIQLSIIGKCFFLYIRKGLCDVHNYFIEEITLDYTIVDMLIWLNHTGTIDVLNNSISTQAVLVKKKMKMGAQDVFFFIWGNMIILYCNGILYIIIHLSVWRSIQPNFKIISKRPVLLYLYCALVPLSILPTFLYLS